MYTHVNGPPEVKNREGEFQYFYGSEEKRSPGQPRAFFLEPYAETVKLCWSKGRRRETRNLFIERFDCRAQFMSFEFNCRTSDNVELILEGTFFWEVVDLPAMVKSTGDSVICKPLATNNEPKPAIPTANSQGLNRVKRPALQPPALQAVFTGHQW